MQKELDLTTANIARKNGERSNINRNVNYDINRIKNKSIQDSHNSKRQKINGELYRGKKVTKMKLKKAVAVAVGVVAVMASVKGLHHLEVTDTYNRELNNFVSDELSYSESVDFLENYDQPKEHYEKYIEALENLDDTEYNFFGDRKDGTHNEVIKSDPNNLIQLSDKEKDAMVNALDDEIDEYKRGK